jgi:hypothetical protein
MMTHVEYDQDNKLFLTCGENGTINIEKLVKNSPIGTDPNTYQKEDRTTVKDNSLTFKSSIKSKFSANQHKQHSSTPMSSEQWTVIRQMKGNFNNKDITTLGFSVYHGMIAIGSTCNEIYIWDY